MCEMSEVNPCWKDFLHGSKKPVLVGDEPRFQCRSIQPDLLQVFLQIVTHLDISKDIICRSGSPCYRLSEADLHSDSFIQEHQRSLESICCCGQWPTTTLLLLVALSAWPLALYLNITVNLIPLSDKQSCLSYLMATYRNTGNIFLQPDKCDDSENE